MRQQSAFVFHATAAGIMAWAWFSVLDLTRGHLMTTQKGGHFQFLTIQGLAAAWLCMVVGLFCDVFPSVTVARHAKKALWITSMHMALVVSSYYWPILWLRPHLILRPTEDIIPIFIDLAVHASPLFSLLIDFFALESKFSKAYVRKAAPAAVAVSSIWYSLFVEYCATYNGVFPYPFLTLNPLPVRILIYTTTTGLALGCIRALNALHA